MQITGFGIVNGQLDSQT